MNLCLNGVGNEAGFMRGMVHLGNLLGCGHAVATKAHIGPEGDLCHRQLTLAVFTHL